MPLVQAALADGLKGLTPTADVSVAAEQLASAWTKYFGDASISGTPVGGSLDSAKAAMKSALLGMSAPGAAAAAIQSGVTAFWGVVAPAAATMWTLPPPATVVSAVPPPTLSAIAAALTGVFAGNTTGGVDLDTAASNVATVLHTNGGLGGISQVFVPPGPAAPVPIL